MAEHLTLVSLRRALSSRAGVSEKVADDFLGALFGSIQDGLKKNGKVTINGLGTFTLQDVPPRQSVNVATGERITIDGYKKVVFNAEKKRSGQAAPAPADIDPLQKLGEQAEEIKGILSELDAMSPSAANTEPVEQIIPDIPTIPVTSVMPQPKETAEPTEPSEKKNQSKPFNPWLTGLITIGVFAMLLIIAYFVLRHQIVNWADGMRTTIEQRVTTPQDASQPQAAPELPVSPEPQETAAPETVQEITDAPQAPANPYYDDAKRKFTEFQATETVGKDSRLAWVAKKHYGEKALWVFIYEANRDRLKSPDHVLPGMQLRIPKLPAELRDVNNPETAALLARLSDKYLK